MKRRNFVAASLEDDFFHQRKIKEKKRKKDKYPLSKIVAESDILKEGW